MEIGEPLFSTPPHIIEAAHEAARAGFTKYTANAGNQSLREKIANRLNADYALSLKPENIVVTVGGVGAISSSVRVLTDLGDEVLLPDPGWPNYEMIVACAGAVPKRYKLYKEKGFLPDISDLEKLLTRRTKVLIINSPSNPLGVVFPADLMKDLVNFAKKRDLFIISDEVYEKIIFEGRHASALSFDTDGRVIAAFSFSKTYAMTGWRVGYAVANESVAQHIAKLQEAYVSCTSSVSQKAAEAAIDGSQECVETMLATYHRNLLAACEVLDKLGLSYCRPQGAFYMWIEVKSSDSAAFARKLLLERKVAVAPGDTFGPSGKSFIRISLASPEEAVREGLNRLGEMVRAGEGEQGWLE
ncbi:aminotransferase class I/II-fold pyridoxal phosphate-dependent enzyme [Moorellaceae bacterium AZ2]